MADDTEDAFVFMDEEPARPVPSAPAACWHVLVVDDEPDVHAATRLALKGLEVEGRHLVFSHAYSAQQAIDLLRQHDDFAVALIDVVMGGDDEGLQLVRHIREALGNRAIRVILRTGQAGYAPQLDTIRAYDINDYKTKSELTQVRLFTSLMMAVRSYAQICHIHELAYYDALVRLPNRNALLAAIDARAHRGDVVALLDLDGFSDINSILDDSYGDAVLQAVAARLRAIFSPTVLVARLGGDLFGLYGRAEDLGPQRLAQAFADPVPIVAGESLRLSATAGLAQLEDGEQAGVAVLKNAGAALKQAKRFQRGKALYFEASQADAARDRIHMLNELRASFSEERLFLHYQPFVRLRDGRVTGAECLLRWKTPDGRYVPPERFIPLAEQSGLMVPLGEWVIRTALRWRRQLAALVDPCFRVAINVSYVQFAEPGFGSRVLALLDEAGVPGSQVEIELTESVAINDVELLATRLRELRTCGIRVAMDDFGTGYSSLSMVQRLRLKLDRLKIDRSFVSGGNDQSFEIARTIIALAGHLQVATIAEGIETEAQRAALLAMGCEEGQGYLFARPLDEAAFARWLLARPAAVRP
ncbi:putative bifunctional diguanylate cyclase/phosphodiesterase [Castellaniella caeni]|uniref:putative bifunctional diguanylate cyclase/phosphodiesterase n=1 Tax=Castellaniella caeni TaxID=266123 RepID=UPI000833725D|nr:EAL domain-containing protein [Castellaniella caeni]